MFSREHLAEVFERAYTTLPVKCRTLESLANFKDLVDPVTRRIHNITKFQAFKISKEGSAIVVKVKKRMHHEDWLGFTGDGKTVGSGEGFTGWRLMRERSVRLEDTSSYLLKTVDAEIIHKIEMRQKASWTRLPAAFPGGERRQVLFSGIHVSVDSSNLGQCIKSYNVAKCCHFVLSTTGTNSSRFTAVAIASSFARTFYIPTF